MSCLAVSSYHRQQANFTEMPSHAPTVDGVPSVNDVRSMMSCSKSGKGHGEDSLCDELFRSASQSLSAQFHSLALKNFLLVDEPVALKGGMMVELFIATTSRIYKCESHRGARVSDHVAKLTHAWARKKAMTAFDVPARPTQHGGSAHMCTGLRAHFSRSFFTMANSTPQPAPQLYCDIVGAFDSVLRQLLFPVCISDSLISYVFKTLNFEADTFHEPAEHINDKSFLRNGGLPKFWHCMLTEFHTDVWFSTQGLAPISDAQVGSIPGDPLGNIVYIFWLQEYMAASSRSSPKQT